MGYTLGQAARAVGMSKTSIFRSIKAGRISGTKDELGQWCIEPCELHRVYPALSDATEGNGAEERAVPGSDVGAVAEATVRAALAEARLSDLKAMLEDMRRGVEDLKRDRDEWRTQAQALRLALPKVHAGPGADVVVAMAANYSLMS
jgi:hypothetical protein